MALLLLKLTFFFLNFFFGSLSVGKNSGYSEGIIGTSGITQEPYVVLGFNKVTATTVICEAGLLVSSTIQMQGHMPLYYTSTPMS